VDERAYGLPPPVVKLLTESREQTMEYESVSTILIRSLDLTSPPVALAYVDAATGMATAKRGAPAPSSCSFWRNAEAGFFFAPAASHDGCPVGAMVMGFELSHPLKEELGGLVSEMINRHYLTSDEPARIPVNASTPEGILYGPLSKFPFAPHVVLCWLTPSQAMIFNEAAGAAIWAEKKVSSVFGRPACAALPYSTKNNTPVLSFGCIGMRTFTEISDDRLLAVIPGTKLQEFAQQAEQTRQINTEMQSLYAARKNDFVARPV
jgi:uncharacterized protein (DUF169 family)